jgi:riboflavin biosynthesis pyrimidine reductase
MPATPSLEFQILFEAPGLPRWELPEAVEGVYGSFGIAESVVYSNFVASIDGIVAVPGVARSSALISGGSRADRFVVALLRAAADVVVIGAGTFEAHEGPWTAEHAYPDAADELISLRHEFGTALKPVLVVVTASGDISRPPPADQAAMVLTTAAGTRRMGGGWAGAEIIDVGESPAVDISSGIEALRARGYRRILTEGGPTLMGDALKAKAIDEVFLTISPLMVGGGEDPGRPTLASGVDLLGEGLSGRLLSARRSGEHLFLRYLVQASDA